MQSDWSRAFLITTQELDFSEPCGFYRFSKVVYHLKSKNTLMDQIFSFKICIANFFQST